jgi:nucleotide-binding universal stress UspA family protein
MIRSILVPLDGSDFAEHALPLAAGLARHAGATLRLARVHVPFMPQASMGAYVPPPDEAHERRDERAYLDGVARRLNEVGALTIETALLEGDPATVLTEFARGGAVDLVVIATHARGAFGRFWLGSVADELSKALAAPVLLMRADEGKVELNREASMKSIVVPLDGSPLAEKAIRPAAELARLFDAELALVRVNRPGILEIPLPEGAGAYSMTGMIEDAKQIEQREREEARKYLDGVAAALAVRGVRCRTDVLIDRTPADGILTEASARHADLIALETHARRGLARMFLGSVADDVLRGGETPILVHHAV